MMNNSWICFQVGARENYKISEILYRINLLDTLVTDIYFSKKYIARYSTYISKKITNRNNHSIPTEKIKQFNQIYLLKYLLKKVVTDFEYQKKFTQYLQARKDISENNVIFSYNYIALEIFKYAKHQRCKTVLGQIDAGPYVGKIVCELANVEFGGIFKPHDLYIEYNVHWHEECDLADRIIVNSEWAKECLIKEGVQEEKINIIPLSFSPPVRSLDYIRKFPEEFNVSRPLLVLFLGSIQLQKGIMPLIRAAKLLLKYPVAFQLVGSLKMPEFILKDLPPNMKWSDRVGFKEVQKYYQNSDIFILPTYSDGFALSQLEAQAWKLPIITTRFCGKVIKNNYNGIILENIHEDDIVKAILIILKNPDLLKYFSNNTIDITQFSSDNMAEKYLNLNNSL